MDPHFVKKLLQRLPADGADGLKIFFDRNRWNGISSANSTSGSGTTGGSYISTDGVGNGGCSAHDHSSHHSYASRSRAKT